MHTVIEPSSFRDSSGFIFYKGNKVFRQVNKIFKDHFDFFVESGLYKTLLKENLILPFKKSAERFSKEESFYCTIETPKVPFISYPYEWSFSQLKDAALLTLEILKKALEHNMILKDASAYNIQFVGGRPTHIDHLSFEKYQEGTPWVAYRQFCQHFLAPLTLMAKKDLKLGALLKVYIDGIPMDLTSNLLPVTSWLNPSLATHIHIHAKSQKTFGKSQNKSRKNKISLSRSSLMGIVDSLHSLVLQLKLPKAKTEWVDYYTFTNYSKSAFEHKKKIIKSMIGKLKPKVVWDLGANTGEFSKEAAALGATVIAFDQDPLAVEKNYLEVKKDNQVRILPLLVDLTNPSAPAGWALEERKSLLERANADCILALALVHHLAIGNNVPLEEIAKFFASLAPFSIIEFVPKTDSQVQKMLSNREDIFDNYNKEFFEKVFSKYFKIESSEKIKNSNRIIYCLVRK